MGKLETDQVYLDRDQMEIHLPRMYAVSQGDTKSNELPNGMEILTTQVAGHMNDKSVGLIKHRDTILKVISKVVYGERERVFYEELQNTQDASLLDIKPFVPKYYGTTTLKRINQEDTYIILEDLTKNLKEPCVMDIKIGRRTWDPFATHEKIINENRKYCGTKRHLGFCIPGFQLYKIANGKLCKYGKDYGKQLDKDTIINALKLFLNADSGLCRNLVVQLLVPLWQIQHWVRNQKKVHLFSSSLLLVYDALQLRECLQKTDRSSALSVGGNLNKYLKRPLSLALTSDAKIRGFSGLQTPDGPELNNLAPNKSGFKFICCPALPSNDCSESVDKLKRTHSAENDYDKDLQNMKRDYVQILDELVREQKMDVWATVNLIDFAHVFPANGEIDANYIHGIDNLVKVFEQLLVETS